MKWITVSFIALFGLILSSCEKETLRQIGFNSSIEMNASGITAIYVGSDASVLYLEGSVSVSEGTINVELVSPGGEIACFSIGSSSANFEISEMYPAEKGYWKLRYTSIEGKGAIDLHLRY